MQRETANAFIENFGGLSFINVVLNEACLNIVNSNKESLNQIHQKDKSFKELNLCEGFTTALSNKLLELYAPKVVPTDGDAKDKMQPQTLPGFVAYAQIEWELTQSNKM